MSQLLAYTVHRLAHSLFPHIHQMIMLVEFIFKEKDIFCLKFELIMEAKKTNNKSFLFIERRRFSLSRV